MAWAQLRCDEVRVKRSESSEGDYAYLGHWEVQRREKVLHVLLAQLFTKNRANGRTQERKVHGVRLIHDILGIFLFFPGVFDTLVSDLGIFVSRVGGRSCSSMRKLVLTRRISYIWKTHCAQQAQAQFW